MSNELMKKLSTQIKKDINSDTNISTSGHILKVNYEHRKVDVSYESNSGGRRIARDIPFPKGEDGVYTTSLETGDMVELSYRNNSRDIMYITNVYRKNKSYEDFEIEKGKRMPYSTSLF